MEKRRCRGVAVIKGSAEAPRLSGIVNFTDTPEGVRVDAHVQGLPPNETGFYAFHIHERGSCLPPDYQSAMGHYNPDDTAHPLHAGDFPMLLATDNGHAWLSFVTTRFDTCEVIGRSVMIHAQRDDYQSQPAGDSGARIGCGLIQPV